MFFVLVLGLFPGDHHRTRVVDRLHRGNVLWIGSLSLMLVLDVGVECRIAEVSFTASTDVVSLSGLVSGASFSFVLLDWHDVVALIV